MKKIKSTEETRQAVKQSMLDFKKYSDWWYNFHINYPYDEYRHINKKDKVMLLKACIVFSRHMRAIEDIAYGLEDE